MLLLLLLLVSTNLYSYTYSKTSEGFFTTAHILLVDPEEEEIHLVSSPERETLLTFTRHYGAVAGVNGSFWKEDGQSAVPIKVDGKWLKRSKKPFAALGWSEGGLHAAIGQIPLDSWESAS